MNCLGALNNTYLGWRTANLFKKYSRTGAFRWVLQKKKNDFLTGHLVAASFESISANGAEILNNTPVQQSFQKWFYLLSYVQI